MASDEELMRALARGDESALAALLDRHEHALAAFIHRNTDGRDVDDLFQETWLRVVRAAGEFDPTRRFSTWLFQIAINLCRDRHRMQVRRATEPTANLDPVEEGRGPDRAALAVDAERLLARLPDEQREALILKYYHDMSEASIAEVLGCPRGTVKSRVHNAISRLADLVADDPDEGVEQ